MGTRRRIALAILLATSAAVAGETDARHEFFAGRAAYDRGNYPVAYQHFKSAYLLSQRPELLYNMSRAQEGMRQYGDAIESLRAYLRLLPNASDRAAVEQHIRALSESQRLATGKPPDNDLHLGQSDWPPQRRTGLIVGVVIASVVVIALAVGLGVGLGTRGAGNSAADVGPLRATP